MSRVGAFLWVVALFGAWGCGADDEPAGSAAALTAALEGAGPGDEVRVAAGTFRGTFQVPAGVTVIGAGADRTTLQSDGADAAVVLESGGSETTTLRALSVQSDGTAAVVARGPGSVAVERVRIDATRGIGLGAEGVAALDLTDLTLQGPLTRDNVTALPVEPTATDTATHGVVLVDVASAQLERVAAAGFAKFGALFVNSGVTWNEGSTSDNVSTGLMVHGGSLEATAVESSGTIGAFTLIPPYGMVFSGGALVQSTGLIVRSSDGYGVLHAGTAGEHTDMVVESSSAAGLWLQDVAGVSVTGAGTRITDNSFAGLVAIDSSDVLVTDALIATTRTARRVAGETGLVEVGDGIQLVRSTDAITLRDVRLDQNQRVGLLLELDGATTEGVALEGVSADGMGAQLGVVAQNGTLVTGWDTGVSRLGDTSANDSSFLASGAALEVAGVVAPTDMPVADDVAGGGLGAVGVVAPTD